MQTDEFGGILLDEPQTDEFGGLLVDDASAVDEFGGQLLHPAELEFDAAGSDPMKQMVAAQKHPEFQAAPPEQQQALLDMWAQTNAANASRDYDRIRAGLEQQADAYAASQIEIGREGDVPFIDEHRYEQLVPGMRERANRLLNEATKGRDFRAEGFGKDLDATGETDSWAARTALQVTAGIGATLKSAFSRLTGDPAAAKQAELDMASLEGAIGERQANGLQRMGTNVASTLGKAAYAGAAGGPGAVIGTFVYDAASRAHAETGDLSYALTVGTIEGLVTAAFQRAGLGGFEKGLKGVRGSGMAGLKQFAKQLSSELAEEEIIGLGQAISAKLEGIDPDALKKFPKQALDIAAQTMLTMGAVKTAASAQNFLEKPSRKSAKEAGVSEIATNHKERVDLVAKVKDALTAQQFREQLDAAATSPEEAEALYGLVEARAEAAGETVDEYVGRRIKKVERTTHEHSAALKQRRAGKFSDTLEQRAFHGSPYKFDKFTTEKIGSGEGAQAYGWGLYFAGEKKVAEYYKNLLSQNRPGLFFGGRGPSQQTQVERDAGAILKPLTQRYGIPEGLEQMKRSLRDNISKSTARWRHSNPDSSELPSDIQGDVDILAVVEQLRPEDIQYGNERSGALYQVDLKPTDEELLDWDKPLRAQAEGVKRALSQLGYDDPKLTGEKLYRVLSSENGGDQDASTILQRHGIRGIKYLDQASRDQGQGSHNFVIFDDADVAIEQVLEQKAQAGPRGEAQFLDDGRAIIRAFEGAQNLSTLAHELGHIFRRDLDGTSLKIAERWAGVKDGKWTRTAEEKFARGWERYLRTGRAPTPKLKGVFEKFKGWLSSIYKSVANSPLNVNFNREMRQVYDSLFLPQGETDVRQTQTPQEAQAAPEREVTTTPAPGMIRFYHGGGKYEGGTRWLTEDPRYAEGYATKGGDGSFVQYVDVPSNHPFLQTVPKAFDDSGTSQRAPYAHFDAPAEIAKGLRRYSPAAQAATPQPAEVLSQDLADRFRGLANHSIEDAARQANYEVDVEMGYPESKAWAAAEGRVAERLQADSVGELQDMLARIDAGDFTLRDMDDTAMLNRLKEAMALDLANPESRQLHRKLHQAFRTARSEQARQLGYRDPLGSQDPVARKRKAITDAIGELDEETYQKIKTELAKEGVDLDNLDDITIDEMKSLRVLDKARPDPSKWDVLYEYWRNAILSGPRTHVTNTLGNTAFAAWNLGPERAVEAAVNLLVKDPKAAQFGEFKYLLGGVLPGIRRGARNAMKSWRLETSALAEELGREGAFKVEGARGVIKGKIGRLVRAMGYRPLLAVDEFAKSVTATMEVGARAFRAGKAQGLEGEALTDYINSQVENLQSEAWGEALAKAEELAFQGHRGIVAEGLSSGGNKLRRIRGARWFLPFVDTPAAIFEEGMKRTPFLGPLLDYAEARRGGANIVDAGMTPTLARQAIASMGILAIWAMTDDEDPWITGAAVLSDKKNRDVSYRTMPPMSIRIGGRAYSYARIEPFATSIAWTVDAINGLKSGNPVSSFVFGTAQQVKNKSYLDGVGDLMDIIEGLGSGESAPFEEYLGKFASSFVPNLWRQTVSSLDGTIPENRVWGKERDHMQRVLRRSVQGAQVPGVDTLPRYDIWGREIRYSDSWGSPVTDFVWSLLSPVKAKDLSTIERADLALVRWNARNPEDQRVYSEPQKFVKFRNKTHYLSDEQYAEYAQLAGQLAQLRVSRMGFSADNPTLQQVDAIADAISGAREQARKALIPKWRYEWAQ